jgi:PST family polysaccharide transporter
VLEVYWATQAVRGAVLLFVTCLFLLLVMCVPALTAHWDLYLLSFMTVWGSYVFSPWLYQGLERMRFTAILHVTGRVTAALALLLLVREPDDYVLAGGIQASATLISGLLGLIVCFRSGMLRWQRPRLSAIRRTLAQGGRLFWSELLDTGVANSGIFVLGLTASSAVVGSYAVIEKLIRAAMSGYLPLSQALLPRAAALLASAGLERAAWRRFGALTLALLAVACLGAAVVSVYASELLVRIFGADLAEHGALLALMVWTLPLDMVNVAAGHLFIFAAGYRNAYAHALAIGAIVRGVLSVVLVLPMGAYAIAVAFLASELCVSAMLLHTLGRIWRGADGILADGPGGAREGVAT